MVQRHRKRVSPGAFTEDEDGTALKPEIFGLTSTEAGGSGVAEAALPSFSFSSSLCFFHASSRSLAVKGLALGAGDAVFDAIRGEEGECR